MSDNKITFTVTVHFENGISIDKKIPLKKVMTYINKKNVIIPDDVDLVEVTGVTENIVVPINMIFVIPVTPKFRNVESISRYMLYERDGGKCCYCGKKITQKEATVDHVIPRSKGGKSTWDNVALSCGHCNRKKGDRTPEQAGMKLNAKLYNPKRKRK